MQARGDDVASKIWKTAGSRFNAARRLQRRHNLSSWTSSLLAVYVVFIQLIDLVVPPEAHLASPALVTVGTAFVAILILVVTILEASRAYQLRAERLHRSGMELGALHDRLKNQVALLQGNAAALAEEVESITAKYHETIARTGENHEPGDYELFKAQHHKDFDVGRPAAIWIHVREGLRVSFWYYLAMLGTPTLAVLLW
jgi:uncharacterized membrane protein (DUF485 family)